MPKVVDSKEVYTSEIGPNAFFLFRPKYLLSLSEESCQHTQLQLQIFLEEVNEYMQIFAISRSYSQSSRFKGSIYL